MTTAGPTAPATSGGLPALGARHPVGLVVLGVVAFSTGPVMIAASTVPGPVFAFWRLWIGSAALGAIAVVHARLHGGWPTRRSWRWALWCGLAFGLHQLTFMAALRRTSVVDVTLMNTLAPLIVAVLAVPLFGERPGPAFRLWSTVAIAGAGAVALLGSSGPDGDPIGIALAAVNVFFYALYFVWSKQGRAHIDTLHFLFGSVLVSAFLVSGYVALAGDPVHTISRHDLALTLAVALLPGIIGHFSVTWSLRWVPANLPPVIMLTIPLMAGAMAWAFLDEVVDVGVMVAGALTLAGVGGAVLSSRSLLAVEALDLAEET